jgi:hypothetical protein
VNAQNAAVEAHYASAKVYDYYKDVHGRTGIDGSDGPGSYTSHDGSTKLVVSRFGNDGGMLGFVLRKVNATPNAASYDITAPEIARYCTKGGKPAISFDERYMVYHHYVGHADYASLGFASAADPVFQDMLAKGTANIMLLDLVSGQETRVTSMRAAPRSL